MMTRTTETMGMDGGRAIIQCYRGAEEKAEQNITERLKVRRLVLKESARDK